MRPIPISVHLALSGLSPTSTGGFLDDEDEGSRLARALIDNGSADLERLLELQNQGWHDQSIESHFQHQRHLADNAPPDLNMQWFRRMKIVLREIDDAVWCVPSRTSLNFLDLGCCPGGFSSYILDKNVYAKGFGVSLPVVEGGHEYLLEEHLRSRFQLCCTNLTYFQLGPSVIDDDRLQSLPPQLKERTFDLALLDGHQLRTQVGALPWDQERLLISQLILALQSVKEGGTIVMKLPLPHKLVCAKILYLFRMLSIELRCWKPESMHINRGTFYAVARGIGKGLKGPRLPDVLVEFRKLWVSLTFGGEEGFGRPMTVKDLDFLIGTDELCGYHLDWLMKLGRPLWRVQKNALEGFYRRKGLI